jgi:hypothetical protein
MSVSSEPEFISCRVTFSHGIEDAVGFAAEFVQLAPSLGFEPARMLIDSKHRAFAKPAFAAHVAADQSLIVTVYTTGPTPRSAYLYLRDPVLKSLDSADRNHALVVQGASLGALFEFLASTDRHFEIISANVAGHVEHSYAEKESLRIGVAGSWDAATVERIRWDARYRLDARTKLIRLSPITVVGATLWATLPPMPRFDPAPIVEDLPGAPGCKVITAWPTLCSPRDPDFLRGTRALRAWLLPYTTQNPADDPANDPA